jgi:hypothetical protein
MEKPSSPEIREKKEEKTYLYHLVPQDMEGTTLHPLNRLKTTHPKLYEKYRARYEGRENVLDQTIHALECAWNDALHLSPVKPEDLKKALIEAGFKPGEMKFYQIDPELLDPQKTTIYLYQNKEAGDQAKPEDFATYDPNSIAEYAKIPQSTIDYYKNEKAEQRKPILFVGIPHILHKGSIDITNLPIITA